MGIRGLESLSEYNTRVQPARKKNFTPVRFSPRFAHIEVRSKLEGKTKESRMTMKVNPKVKGGRLAFNDNTSVR